MREPIQVDIYVHLGFVYGKHAWSASVDDDGNGTLSVFRYSRAERRVVPFVHPFRVSRSELAAFRGALFQSDFFALRDAYGREATDVTYRWIRVRLGEREKAIWILYTDPRELRASGTYAEARELLLGVWRRAAAWPDDEGVDEDNADRLPEPRPGLFDMVEFDLAIFDSDEK